MERGITREEWVDGRMDGWMDRWMDGGGGRGHESRNRGTENKMKGKKEPKEPNEIGGATTKKTEGGGN